MITSRLLARNAALNLAAQILPLFIAIAAFRPLTQALGTNRFGVLTLAWTLIGYFGLFDFGMGRALTQAASEALGKGDQARLNRLGSTGVVIMFVLGIVGGALLVAMTSTIVYDLLKMDDSLRSEAAMSFYLLAVSLPFVMGTLGIRALLEAHQHFGMATALRLPYAVFNFLAPLLVLPFTNSLTVIVGVLVLGRVATWIAHIVFGFRRYPWLKNSPIGNLTEMLPLLRAGGWMTISNIVSPLMVNLDRFLIGAFLSMAAVAYYVTPFEVITKLLFVPAGILAVFFPAFAATFVQDRFRTAQIMDRVARLLLVLIFPVVLVVVVFAHEALLLWLGPEYANESAHVLQLLAVGVFINSIGQVPFALLQATGRSDLTAKLHLLELPVYAIMIFFLARSYGLTGVALAWTGRVVIDTCFLLWMTQRRLVESAPHIQRIVGWMALLLAVVAGVAVVPGLTLRIVLTAAVGGMFAVVAWRKVLVPTERAALVAIVSRKPGSIATIV